MDISKPNKLIVAGNLEQVNQIKRELGFKEGRHPEFFVVKIGSSLPAYRFDYIFLTDYAQYVVRAARGAESDTLHHWIRVNLEFRRGIGSRAVLL